MPSKLLALVLVCALCLASVSAGEQVIIDVQNVHHVLLPGDQGVHKVTVRGLIDEPVYGIANRKNGTNAQYHWGTDYPGGLPKLEVRKDIERAFTIMTKAPLCSTPGDHTLYFTYDVTSPVSESIAFNIHTVFFVNTELEAGLTKDIFGPGEQLYLDYTIRRPEHGVSYNATLSVLGPGRKVVARSHQPIDLSCEMQGSIRHAVSVDVPDERGRYTARLEIVSGARIVDYLETPFAVVFAEDPLFTLTNYTRLVNQYDPVVVNTTLEKWNDILRRDNTISVQLTWNNTAYVNQTFSVDQLCTNVLDKITCPLDLGRLPLHDYEGRIIYEGLVTFSTDGDEQEEALEIEVREFSPGFEQFRPVTKDVEGNASTIVFTSLTNPGLPYELFLRCGGNETLLDRRCDVGEYGIDRCNVSTPATRDPLACNLIGRIYYRGFEAGNESFPVTLHPAGLVCEIYGFECTFMAVSFAFAFASFLFFVRWRIGGGSSITRFKFVVESKNLRRHTPTDYVKRFEEAYWYLGW
ncbi:MAG: hypothetical protein QF415_05095 [Candidatus Undinarchaeales archaeon]|nr:hypothetical protein [Candidatus Undinarchaeales archaeon]